VGTTQRIISNLIFKPFLNVFFRFKVTGRENIKKLSAPLLIIGNHNFFIDSFALGASLPFGTKLFPINIMGEIDHFFNPTLEFFKKIGVIKIIYSLCNVFPAIRGKELKIALEKPVEIIKNKGTVFLHPEGRIVKGEEIGQFKRGASYLAIKTGVKVLPVVFKIEKKTSKINLRRNYCVKIGQPFTLPKETSVESGAEIMREIITNLYQSIS